MVLLVRAVTVNNENSSAPDPLAGSMKELNRRPSMLSRHANPVPKYDVDYDERRGDAVWTCINMDIPPPSKLWVPKEEYRTKAIGVIDGDENIDKEHPAIINLIHQVRQAAASRCSCTIINIGTPHSNSEDFFSNIVDLLMRTIGPTAERALQTVADELANEKQMQRLMLNETEEEAESSVLIASEKLAADEIKAFVRPPSPSIKDMSPHLQRALRTASSARKMMTTRFGIYTSTSNEIILPPKHNNSLKAKGLEGFKSPRSKIRDSSIVYGGAIRGDGPRDSLPSPKRRLSLRRLSSLRLMQQLADQEPDPVEPIKKNGWGSDEKMTVYRFNGEDSYISLPPIPDLEDLIKGFSVDFWLQTDCKIADGRKTILVVGVGSGMDTGMVFHIGLNWHHDFEEHIRLYIRDASNRVLECVVLMPYSSLTTGNDLHHIKLEVISLEENKVSASINGELMERVQFLQVEHPVTFNKWISPVFLGGQLDDDRVPLNCFRGTICDLRICSHEKKPILVWPLNGAKTENDTLFESTGTIPAYHQEIISNVEEIERPIQDVVPVFDGVNTILNMGHMGCFGNFLNRFHIEFKFRTTQTKRVMSLFGVTDSQYSMCEVGLILNAEPSTIGNTRYRYNEYNITFYIIDCNGMCLSALIRGSERNNVMDGKWHTISLKLIDSETNQLDVTINGLRREVIVIVKECPKAFVMLRDWVCIGGHNVRSWKVKNLFEGEMRKCSITLRGSEFSILDFHEGPGSFMVQDQSGRHNHGLWQDAVTRKNIKLTMNWSLFREFPIGNQDDDDDGDSSSRCRTPADRKFIVIPRHNNVYFAVIRFGTGLVYGHLEEQIYNVLTDTVVHDLEESNEHAKEKDPQGFEKWITLPKSCFKVADSIPSMIDEIDNALLRLKSTKANAHTLVVCRIGDANISLLDISGPHGVGTITYDPALLHWVPHRVANDGVLNKRMITLNDITIGVIRTLMEVSITPSIVAKLGPFNQRNRNITAAALLQSLRNLGIKYRLALTLHNLLINVEYSSALHFISTCPKECSRDDVLSVTCLMNALRESAHDRAALFIQRNWRAKAAKLLTARLVKERSIRKVRVGEIIALRKSNDLVLAKNSMRAIVITLHAFAAEALTAPADISIVEEVISGLSLQGYEVEHIKNPTKHKLLEVLETIDANSSNFVYIHGYGGLIHVRCPPPLALDTFAMELEEEAGRAEVSAEWATAVGGLFQEIICDRAAVNEVLANKPKKKKKKATSPRWGSKKTAPPTKQELAEQLEVILAHYRHTKEELETYEQEERMSSFLDEENGRAIIMGEINRATRDVSDFYREHGRPAYYIYHADSCRLEPYTHDVLSVESIISKILSPSTLGTQTVVAIDLQPPIEVHRDNRRSNTPFTTTPIQKQRGAAFFACSTGHSFTFDYDLSGQHNVLSWIMVKALKGHCPRLPIKTNDRFLQGGVETTGGARDWRSLATYVVTKIHKMIPSIATSHLQGFERNVKANKASNDKVHPHIAMLSQEFEYVADVVPIRQEPFDEEAKERRRKEREMKRVISYATIACDSTKVIADMAYEFQPILKHCTITEITPMPSVLLVLVDQNTSIDSVILEKFMDEINKYLQCSVEFKLKLTPNGILVEIQGTDRQKISQTLVTMANRGTIFNVPLAPYANVRDTRIERVELMYSVKVSTSYRKFRKQQKEFLVCTIPSPHLHVLNFE